MGGHSDDALAINHYWRITGFHGEEADLPPFEGVPKFVILTGLNVLNVLNFLKNADWRR